MFLNNVWLLNPNPFRWSSKSSEDQNPNTTELNPDLLLLSKTDGKNINQDLNEAHFTRKSVQIFVL
jgi:hypothetical protein